MTITLILLGGTALGVALGLAGVYLTLSRSGESLTPF